MSLQQKKAIFFLLSFCIINAISAIPKYTFLHVRKQNSR